jgi:hypothetical protein
MGPKLNLQATKVTILPIPGKNVLILDQKAKKLAF